MYEGGTAKLALGRRIKRRTVRVNFVAFRILRQTRDKMRQKQTDVGTYLTELCVLRVIT